MLFEQFGIEEADLDYTFYINKKGKIYLINNAVKNVDLEQYRIDSLGMYFGTVSNYDGKIGEKNKQQEIRLSIEGSQMLGPKATKNIIDITEEQRKQWMKGIDLPYNTDILGFALIKYGNDFLGCGKKRGDILLNFLPKSRRILCDD